MIAGVTSIKLVALPTQKPSEKRERDYQLKHKSGGTWEELWRHPTSARWTRRLSPVNKNGSTESMAS